MRVKLINQLFPLTVCLISATNFFSNFKVMLDASGKTSLTVFYLQLVVKVFSESYLYCFWLVCCL